jgi:hypothetical protein
MVKLENPTLWFLSIKGIERERPILDEIGRYDKK